jgi:hypothetical protein
MGWSGFTSMELTDEEKLDAMPSLAPALKDQPDYPWGLRISLTDREFAKLGIKPPKSTDEVIDIRALCAVRSVSTDKTADGKECCRVELQIEKLALENENDEEDGEED